MPFEDPSPPKRLLENPTHGFTSVMVVIHRAHGFRFVIYTSDHEPAHVHITGSGQAKVNLLGRDGAPELVWSIGIKRGDMRRLTGRSRAATRCVLAGVGANSWPA